MKYQYNSLTVCTIRAPKVHDITHSIVTGLNSVAKVQITKEPPIEGSSSLRNDIRIVAMQSARIQDADIDIMVKSIATGGRSNPSRLTNTRIQFTTRNPSAPFNPATITPACTLQLDTMLSQWRKVKRDKVEGVVGYERISKFHSLPITTGGYCDGEGIRLFQSWKMGMNPGFFTNMIQDISTKLIKYRASRGKVLQSE
jgi:hypothetical protein